MASSVKYVRVGPNSATIAEARHRVFEFFKTACRSIPTIMEVYNLDDVVTPSQLRSTVASEIRKNANVNNPKGIIDMLLFKGTEELNNIVEHSKQRHHILGQYVLNRQDASQELGSQGHGSEFMRNFLRSNYF